MERVCNKYLVFLTVLFIMGVMAEVCLANSTITTPAGNPATLTTGEPRYAYTYAFAGTGGTTWSVIAGSLPPGLTLNSSTGRLTGTPSTLGTYTFTVRLNATTGTSATRDCTLVIAGCVLGGGGTTANGTISFGNIDPSLAITIYGTVTQQVSFTCLLGQAYTVTASPASGWTMTSGTNTIPYTLGIAASGTYSGAAVNVLTPPGTGGSSITPANFQNKPAGSYKNPSLVRVYVRYTAISTQRTFTVSLAAATGVIGTVISTCAVSQSPSTLTFNINPSVTGTVSGTILTDMQIKCTKGSSFSISAASSCSGLSKTYPPTCGGYIIPYTFGYSPGYTSGQGFGIAIPMNISGSVSSTNYQNAPVGSYGDLQTLTITY